MKKAYKISRRILLAFLLVMLALWLLVQMPFFQNWLVHTVASRLSKKLHTTVQVKNVSIGFFNKLNIEGVYVADLRKDTIASIGLVQVNITDWFFLKDSADIKYVKLKDVTAKLYRRTDSVWNYQFLVDYFTSDSKESSKGGGIALRLETVDLENIHLYQLDEWRGKSVIAGIGKMHLEANNINFDKGIFDIEKLEIDKPEFREIRKRGVWRMTDSIGYRQMRDKEKAADTLPPSLDAGKFVFKINKLDIKDGIIQLYNRRRKPSEDGLFDERDIIITGITGQIKQMNFVGDTLAAQVDIKAEERSGIVVKRVQTKLKIHPQLMEFADLDLQLNESHIGNYYSMRYKSLDDMEEFIDQVKLTARLQNSTISMHDIAFFASELKSIKQVAVLTGNAKGTISNFFVDNLDLKTGQSRITGSYNMAGLTDINKTILNLHTGGSQIALADVAVWAPALLSLRNTPVGKLGVVTYTGSFAGTVYDFKAIGSIKSAVGQMDANFALKMEGAGKGYTGIISNAKINGGKFLDVPQLGYLEFDGTISSKGFGANDALFIKGNIAKGNYAGYTYQNIAADGKFQSNVLTAKLDLNDDNLAGNFETVLDFNKEKNRYNARGKLDTANLQAIGIVKDSLMFSGDFDVDFQGSTIDNFLGYARFQNAKVMHGQTPFSFDSLLLQSELDTSGVKKLSLHTNEVDAWVEGKFNISNLGNSFQYFLSRYYPSFIDAPKSVVTDQDFTFNITTRKAEPFLFFIDKRIKGLNDSKLAGSLNTSKSELFLNVDVPYFTYNDIRAENISLKGSGDGNTLNVMGAIDNLQVNDSIGFPNAVMRINTGHDTTHVAITTSTDGPLGGAELDAFIYSKPDGFIADFNESSFIINNKKWTIQSQANIELKKGYLTSSGITLQQEDQTIKLYTTPSEEGNWNNAHIEIKNLNTADILPYFLTEPRIEGLASGNVTIVDPLGTPHIVSQLTLDQFRFNDDSVGSVKLNADYYTKSKKLLADIESLNEGYDFSGKIAIDLKDSSAATINSTLPIRNMRVNILEKYLGSVFDNVDGYASGDLRIVGKASAPSLLGKITLKKAILKIGYTKCVYTIDSALLNFGDNFIDLGTLELKDEKNRTGTLEGKFYHRFFDSLSFNLAMRTNGMTVLNTSRNDNSLFYGKAIARATFEMNGPVSNLNMRVTGTPTDSSHIYVTTKGSKESGEADFIIFKTYGREMVWQPDSNQTNLRVDLDLTANPLCKIDVILDELTGDVIRATGSGNIKIHTGTTDATVMRGRYKIEQGSYNYNFQTLIRKPFFFSADDDNFIEWTGDPLDATLNIKAIFVANNVSMRDLAGSDNGGNNSILDQDARNAKGDVNVIAKINGKLSKPDFDFDIEFPQSNSMRNNLTAADMLRRIREDNTEKLRQVTYLLVFKSFAPYKQGASLRNPGTDLAVNTITELVSREMAKILTNVVHQLTGDQSLNVDINTSVYNSANLVNGTTSANSLYDRVNVGFNINRSFLNNRVVVNVGSDFDVNVRSTTSTGFQFLPDISVEFILTSNRRLRAILFKRDNLDIGGRRNRAGASLSYRKDFDKLLFLRF